MKQAPIGKAINDVFIISYPKFYLVRQSKYSSMRHNAPIVAMKTNIKRVARQAVDIMFIP